MAATTIGFRPLAADDAALLHRWLTAPHVAHWWHPARDVTIDDVRARYQGRMSGVSATRAFVVTFDATDAGYVQAYPIDAYPEYRDVVAAGDGWVGIDFFIGESGYLRRGLGTLMIDRFVTEVVFSDPAVTVCMAGPDPANEASVRALEAAGFVASRVVEVAGEEGGTEVVMVRRRI